MNTAFGIERDIDCSINTREKGKGRWEQVIGPLK